jgi:hypothetical protein
MLRSFAHHSVEGGRVVVRHFSVDHHGVRSLAPHLTEARMFRTEHRRPVTHHHRSVSQRAPSKKTKSKKKSGGSVRPRKASHKKPRKTSHKKDRHVSFAPERKARKSKLPPL